MTVKSLLQLALLAYPAFGVPAAYAVTNVLGDEIVIMDDSAIHDDIASYMLDRSLDTSSQSKEAVVASIDLWQRIKDGYGIPELQSPITSTHESWYASRPEYVKRMVERSQRYLYHIVEEVQKRGMPTEIALLPMVESAFNPQALSRSSASGIWQFIPSTGKNFGLKQDWWTDGRRDVTAATDAALNYLQKLYIMFGTWDLALAAYNAGEGTVSRAMARNRSLGRPTNYQSLELSEETRNYVPKLQAIKNIMTHPKQYGLEIESIPNRPYFTKVSAPQQIDAKLAAELAEIPYEEFASLNPEYNRPVLTANGSNAHEILLPVDASETFASNLAVYDKPLVSWQTYHAKRGDRMDNIAEKFGIELAKLKDVNGLSANSIKSNMPLLVPTQATDNTDSSSETAIIFEAHEKISLATNSASPSKLNRHTVKSGETISSIAKRYGVNTQQLLSANGLKTSSRIKPGQSLIITGSQTQSASQSRKSGNRHYVIKRGDTLDSIARKFDVHSKDLKRWNNLTGSHIIPGNKLTVSRPDEA
ncbi:membrane-bound lytic murein transglycosylase D [Methylobacillus rhizosphaerae]|uniref:Membrane-bound lytic murein transglycosylase D n=1 Tax=Methylobacillus rhizosphaerae TaxID=551994 RepID=A0A238ZV83_9PROT|nr:LysM peptidoglycan-binding domain-containing protein [Methylobacillus rhizosphaerae]SNR86573.1 membrane-bound lytic murein transglycosylase D [Methylobacillus rhizosphaerae]